MCWWLEVSRLQGWQQRTERKGSLAWFPLTGSEERVAGPALRRELGLGAPRGVRDLADLKDGLWALLGCLGGRLPGVSGSLGEVPGSRQVPAEARVARGLENHWVSQ